MQRENPRESASIFPKEAMPIPVVFVLHPNWSAFFGRMEVFSTELSVKRKPCGYSLAFRVILPTTVVPIVCALLVKSINAKAPRKPSMPEWHDLQVVRY